MAEAENFFEEDENLPGDNQDDQVADEQHEEPRQEHRAEHQNEMPKGFKTLEEWTALGKDPKEWTPPELFKANSRIIELTKTITNQRKDFESRLEGQAVLHRAQLAMQRQELENKRDQAISVADVDEVKRLDKQISDNERMSNLVSQQPQQQHVPPEVAEWNADNPWCTPEHPLYEKVNELYSEAISNNKTVAGALRYVDREIAKIQAQEEAKPSIQKKVPARAVVDSPSQSSFGKQDSPVIAWSSLTSTERAIWDAGFFPDTKEGKAKFLKSVADDRRLNK